MANVCVITGGGSKMALETARNINKDVILVLSGETVSALENTKETLEAEGFEVHLAACDVSQRRDVHELCLLACDLGTIKTVIHTEEISPAAEDPEKIIMINAAGTKNVNMEFFKYMNDGGVIVDIASCQAYDTPKTLVKPQIYEKAEYEEAEFIRLMNNEANMASGNFSKPGLAYMLSKNFVIWYAQKCAHEYVKKGIRVVSVSPGLVETDPEAREMEMPASEEQMIARTCENRKGKPEELGFAIAAIADERNGYLCGIDIRVDGGASTGEQFKG